MRKVIALSSLLPVVGAAFLMLLVPPALCRQGASCPMRSGRTQSAAGLPCLPGPTFDCCHGDKTPPSNGSARLAASLLAHGATAAVGTALLPPEPALVAVPRSAAQTGSPVSEVPLYTFLATFLI